MALQKLGKYEIISEIGRGAMGVVYKAFDPVLEREVALKTMMASMSGMDAESKGRFYREARSAAKLTHRNIVTIYDMGEEEGVPYIAMEFLDGVDLHRKMKREGPLPLREGLKIAVQVLQGLHYAHQFQIVHRDIKPANIYILKNGTAKILDFGIAKLASSEMTRTGMVLGTVDYMSPEQIRADKSVDGRSDLFSAGVILFELMAGRKPFPGETITQVMFKIVHDPPGEMPTERELPPRLLAASRRSLEKDPAKRFQNGEEFALEIEGVVQEIDAELTTVRQMSSSGTLDSKSGLTNARRLFEGGSFEESAALLKEVLKKDPGNQDATALFTVVERRIGGSDKTVMLDHEEPTSPSSPRSSSIEEILAEIEEERKTGHDPARSDVEAKDLTLRLEEPGGRAAAPPAPVPAPRPPEPAAPAIDRLTEQLGPTALKARAGAGGSAPTVRAEAKPVPVEAKAEKKGVPPPAPSTPAARPPERRAPAASPAPGATPSRTPMALIVGGVALAAVVVAGFLLMRGRGQTAQTASQQAAAPSPSPGGSNATAAAAAAGYLAIDAEPWAEVASVRDAATGKTVALPSEAGRAGPTTPVVLDLPPGRYEIVLRNPDYPETTVRDLEVVSGQWNRTHQMMPGFSYKPKMPAGSP
jgi:serine/threonine protein kinase